MGISVKEHFLIPYQIIHKFWSWLAIYFKVFLI